MRNWLKQAVKRAEADGVHFFDPRDAAYFPSQLYYAHALSPAAQEGHPRHWPGIRIRARWKSIPGYLRWTWLPPWPFPLPVMVEMPRRSFAPCPRPAEIDGPGMTSCIPLIRNTGAESIQPPPCSSTPEAIMLMTEPPWSYPVTCNPAGINIPQSRQGTMQAYWPCIPLCVFPRKLSKSSR